MTLYILALVFGALFSSPIIWLCARHLAKIENTGFKKSFMTALLANVIVVAIGYSYVEHDWGKDFMLWVSDFAGNNTISAILALSALAFSFIWVGVTKMVFKVNWKQAFMTNIVWIVILAAFNGFIMSKM